MAKNRREKVAYVWESEYSRPPDDSSHKTFGQKVTLADATEDR